MSPHTTTALESHTPRRVGGLLNEQASNWVAARRTRPPSSKADFGISAGAAGLVAGSSALSRYPFVGVTYGIAKKA